MNYQEEGKRIAAQLGEGTIYNGPQMYGETFLAHMFTDSVTHTTFAARTLDQAKAQLITVRKDFLRHGHKVQIPSYPGLPDPLGIKEGLKKDLDTIYKTLTRVK